MADTARPALPRRDRLIAGGGLLAVAALGWAWLWHDTARMAAMADMPMAPAGFDSLPYLFAMWAIMMAAMMLPSALPAILLCAAVSRRSGAALPAAWTFAAGYVAVWSLFSLLAASLQAGLAEARLISPMMASNSRELSGALLVLAGAWQFAPFKEACLRVCRDPLQIFLFRHRPGPLGPFRMGAEHGLTCLGCCWALMLLLFAAGVMSLVWVAALALWVLAEKALPFGRAIARAGGAALVVAGAALLLGA